MITVKVEEAGGLACGPVLNTSLLHLGADDLRGRLLRARPNTAPPWLDSRQPIGSSRQKPSPGTRPAVEPASTRREKISYKTRAFLVYARSS
ncbi:MAG: hypothetical protein ACLQKY_16860 [Terracidiphilus sp.]